MLTQQQTLNLCKSSGLIFRFIDLVERCWTYKANPFWLITDPKEKPIDFQPWFSNFMVIIATLVRPVSRSSSARRMSPSNSSTSTWPRASTNPQSTWSTNLSALLLISYAILFLLYFFVIWPCVQDDDGFILFESRAIGHYIASKYADQGTPLIPTDLKANALLHQAVSMEITSFNEYVEKIVAERVWKR